MNSNMPKFFHRLRRKTQEIIRVGFIGDSFSLTENAKLIYAYMGINNEKIATMVFNLGEIDEVTEHFRKQATGWQDAVKLSAMEIANSVYYNQIDILIALSDNKIIRDVLAYNSAPVQIAGANAISLKDKLSENNTPYVDAIFGDNFIRAIDGIDTIELNSAFCYLPFFGDTNIKIREKNDNIIIGVLFDENDNLTRILDEIPNAKLKIFSKNKNRVKIVDDRIILSEINGDSFYKDVDLFLDLHSSEEYAVLINTLYMGTPIVSMTEVGRSVLNAIGLSELSTDNETNFINKVVSLAKDRELLNTLHNNLRNIMENSLIMNKDVFAENIKSAVFAAFDYLTSLRENIPNEQEFKVVWDIFSNLEDLNDTKFALLDRILLYKPKDPAMLKKIALYVAYDNIESIIEAILFMPKDSLYYYYLIGLGYYEKKIYSEAEDCLLEAIKFQSNDNDDKFIISSAYHLLGNLYKEMGEIEQSAKMHLEASVTTPSDHKSAEYERYSNYLLTLHYLNISPKKILESSKGYAKLFNNIPKFSHKNKSKNKKIRVGYISPDFRNHVVSCFAGAFFFANNSERFETYAYMLGREDFVTNVFKLKADKYRDLSALCYDDAAKIIYDDKIDILVDLAGHTANNGLPILARKPAPIQISGIGYFSTTGLPEIDYFLVDKYTAPDTEDENFTEKLLRLPNSQFSFMHIMNKNYNITGLAFEKNDYITFGTMNNSNKINYEVLSVWSKILDKVPNSKLFLKCGLYHDNEWRLNKEAERLRKANIDLNRVIFEGFSNDYLQAYNRIDIALDTFPYPGGGTTCDALMMGAPVVTLAGSSNHERFGKSILCNLNLDELVANNLNEYINIAVSLANDKVRLKNLHLEIPTRMKNSPIMDQTKYMEDLEAVYEKIYEERLNGNK